MLTIKHPHTDTHNTYIHTLTDIHIHTAENIQIYVQTRGHPRRETQTHIHSHRHESAYLCPFLKGCFI